MPTAPKPRPSPHGTARQQYDRNRGSAQDRGYDYQWQREKAAAMEKLIADSGNPMCRYCDRRLATTLDHAVPPSRLHRFGTVNYQRLFSDQRLWVPACIGCNTEKGDKLPDELKVECPELWRKLCAVLGERGVEVERILRRWV